MRFTLAGMLIILMSSVLFADNVSSDNIQLFYDRMAQIRGLIPMPATDSGLPAPKCGTTTALAAMSILRQSYNPELANILARPVLPDTLGSEHFLIHYTTTGPDSCFGHDIINPSNGAPVYIDTALQIFEYSWNMEIDDANLGYNTPPIDSMQGGDNRYDVYIVDLGPGYYGLTYPEALVDSCQAYSYIEIDNNFAGTHYESDPITGFKVTAAHEFFHAIQFGYDVFEYDYINAADPNTYKPWWLEASATWMETLVYPDIKDFINYLPTFYGFPWLGLGSFAYQGYPQAYHPYASCVWPIYLSQKYGSIFIRRIWEACATVEGYNTLPATNSLLNGLGRSLPDAFLEFAVWNFHTGSRSIPSMFYAQADSFPLMSSTTSISDLTILPTSIAGFPNPPENLAANYIVITSGQTSGGVLVNFNGQDITNAGWYVALLGYRHGDSNWKKMNVDTSNGLGQGSWCNWNYYDSVVVIPTVSGLTPTYVSYTYAGNVAYDISLTNCEQDLGLKLLASYPSPFMIDGNISTEMTIQYLMSERFNISRMTISIFDVGGNLVRVLNGSQSYLGGLIKWDGKNDNDEYVAGGIYIMVMTADEHTSKAKIAVINNSR